MMLFKERHSIFIFWCNIYLENSPSTTEHFFNIIYKVLGQFPHGMLQKYESEILFLDDFFKNYYFIFLLTTSGLFFPLCLRGLVYANCILYRGVYIYLIPLHKQNVTQGQFSNEG